MDNLLDKVHPELADKIRKILAAMNALGFAMKPVQGFRTAEYQHELWLKGRDASGKVIDAHKIVTKCDGYILQSQHQLGRAVDCAFVDEHGNVSFASTMPWKLYGEMGKALGLKWGGNFPSPDLDHLEMV